MRSKFKTDIELQQAVQSAVERLSHWREGGTSFTCQLYYLMAKADPLNTAILADAYPVEACVFISWRNSRDEAAFFAEYGIQVSA